jgi:hypothetical protein
MKKKFKGMLIVALVMICSFAFIHSAMALFGGKDWTFYDGSTTAELESAGKMKNNFKTSIIPHEGEGSVTVRTTINWRILFSDKSASRTNVIDNYDWRRLQWDIGGSYQIDYEWDYVQGSGWAFVEVGYFDV